MRSSFLTIFGGALLTVGTAHAECFGPACDDVVISKEGRCAVVINDGRDRVRVSPANERGRQSAGIVVYVAGRSSEVIRNVDGNCMTNYHRNYRADYDE
jgi:hypothetical protein